MSTFHPDIARQQRVHCPAERFRIPARRDLDAHSLAMRMHSCIRATGTDCGDGCATKAGEHRLHLALDRASSGLALPTGEFPSVILRYEENPVHVAHAGKLSSLTSA